MATVQDYLRLAASQIGVQEDPPESNRVKYSLWYGAIGPWCQMFQNWLHVQVGLEPPGFVAGTVPKGSAFTPTCAQWFATRGRWSKTPQVGALVYYDFPADGIDRISHVGVVELVNPDGSITTIEGNTDEAGGRTGGKVMRKVRRGASIVGYGMPNYESEATVSKADVLDALKDPDGVKLLRKAIWGGSGDEVPSIFGTVNAAQVVEVAATGVQQLALRLKDLDARLGGNQAALLGAIAALPTATGEVDLDDADLARLAELVQLDPAALVAAWRADLAAKPLTIHP